MSILVSPIRQSVSGVVTGEQEHTEKKVEQW
jgi:hypothetical protein